MLKHHMWLPSRMNSRGDTPTRCHVPTAIACSPADRHIGANQLGRADFWQGEYQPPKLDTSIRSWDTSPGATPARDQIVVTAELLEEVEKWDELVPISRKEETQSHYTPMEEVSPVVEAQHREAQQEKMFARMHQMLVQVERKLENLEARGSPLLESPAAPSKSCTCQIC